jgi:hypothetical protein
MNTSIVGVKNNETIIDRSPPQFKTTANEGQKTSERIVLMELTLPKWKILVI